MGRCAGQIRGDSDIAGVGVLFSLFSAYAARLTSSSVKVVSAIFTNAAITIIISASLWIYIYIYLRKDHLDLSRQLPKWVQIVKSALVIQGDSQLIGVLAIIITSLVQMKSTVEIPLYHTFIARSLVDIALTGHAAAIVHVYPTQHHWGLRLVLLATTMLLWQWWGFLALQNFRTSNREGDHCFEDANGLLGEYTTWFWMSLFWTPIAYLFLYLNLWESGRTLTNRFEEIVVTGPKLLRRTISLRFQTSAKSSANPSSTDALRNFVTSIGFTIIILISWMLALVFPASRLLNPIQSLLSFIWDAYDVWVLREANARVIYEHPDKPPSPPFLTVDDPEDHWGFGQILPFVMLLFPILSALDMFNGIIKRPASYPSYF